jgi:DNA-directed RNA polymerase specialized sigma24 family protein
MRALSEMSSRQRAVFVMCELEGFTAKEVAEALGIAETAATARRRKARAAFARFCARLRAEEQALEEGSLAVGTGSLGGGHG